MSVFIQNGRVITAVDDYEADIFIEDENVFRGDQCFSYMKPKNGRV